MWSAPRGNPASARIPGGSCRTTPRRSSSGTRRRRAAWARNAPCPPRTPSKSAADAGHGHADHTPGSGHDPLRTSRSRVGWAECQTRGQTRLRSLQGVAEPVSDSARALLAGSRIFDISDVSDAETGIAAVQTCRGSHLRTPCLRDRAPTTRATFMSLAPWTKLGTLRVWRLVPA